MLAGRALARSVLKSLAGGQRDARLISSQMLANSTVDLTASCLTDEILACMPADPPQQPEDLEFKFRGFRYY